MSGCLVSRNDLVSAAKYDKLAADRKYAAVRNNSAFCHEAGLIACPNHRFAIRYCELAAQAGVSLSLRHLGRCSEFGHGTPKDSSRAAESYKVSADESHSISVSVFSMGLASTKMWRSHSVIIKSPPTEKNATELIVTLPSIAPLHGNMGSVLTSIWRRLHHITLELAKAGSLRSSRFAAFAV
jgi:TPR repeat protein